MFKKISILLPTRGRVPSLGRFLRSMRQMETDYSEVELLLRCDDDDPETIAFLRSEGFEPLVGPRLRGYSSMPEFLNELLAHSTGDIILLLNDDGEFFTKDWSKPLLAAANRYPDGIFNIGIDAALNSFLHPFPAFSRQYAEVIGHVSPEGLVCIDIYHLSIMRAFDRVIDLGSVVFKHYWLEELARETDPLHMAALTSSIDIYAVAPKRPERYEEIFFNWLPEYRAKHYRFVTTAIDKLTAAVQSGKFGRTFDTIGAALADALSPSQRQIGTVLVAGDAASDIGGIAGARIVQLVPADLSKPEFAEENGRLVCRGDLADAAFLRAVIGRVGTVDTLVLWGTTSAQGRLIYSNLRGGKTSPVVIFVSPEPGDDVEAFVNDLAGGGYDRTRHTMRLLPIYRGHACAWIEDPRNTGVASGQPPTAAQRTRKAGLAAAFRYRRELSLIGMLLDRAWYLSQNPDVAAAGIDPLLHYLRHGGFEGRDPHPLFDSDWYLKRYPDVAAAGINPLVHYLKHGGFEGRDPNPLFDSDWYLSAYPDAAAAKINPLVHSVRRRKRATTPP